jgi:hypothetical protein
MPKARGNHYLSTPSVRPVRRGFASRFRSIHADFRSVTGNASTLPRSDGGSHFEALRKLCGM